MTVTHSKMLKTRRKNQSTQKRLARVAKLAKKQGKQSAKVVRADAGAKEGA